MKITHNDKQLFIDWFLENYQLRMRKSDEILKLIRSDEELLENVHFVEDIKNCPRGLILTTECYNGTSIRFYNNGSVLIVTEHIYQEILDNKNEKIYIQLNFSNNKLSEEYANVLEKNPYLEEKVPTHLSIEAEEFLDHCVKQFELERLLKEIDDSLDKRDKNKFFELTEQLKKVSV